MLFGMSRKAVEITLTINEREQLERWSRGHQTPRSLAERAQIVLLVVGGIIPDEDIPGLKQAGVAEVFQPGASTQTIVEYIKNKVASG